MKRTPNILLALASCILASCSSLGGGGGGADNLPNRGIVPYERVPSEAEGEPHFVLKSDDPSEFIYVEPHALVDEEGEIILFVERRVPGEMSGEIMRCMLNEELACKSPPEPVLDARGEGMAWLGERIGAPSLLNDDEGWLMAFAYGEGAGIGLASSSDGRNFFVEETPLLTLSGLLEAKGIDSPSLIRTTEGYRLYYEGRAEDGVTRILYADAKEKDNFERIGIALDVGAQCKDVQGQPEPCWDAQGVASPEVRPAISATGRPLYRLFYTGYGEGGFNLGFGASWDGTTFERFAYNPVLASAAVERQATNIRHAERYLLFFEERTSNTLRGIAAAINAPEAPSETF